MQTQPSGNFPEQSGETIAHHSTKLQVAASPIPSQAIDSKTGTDGKRAGSVCGIKRAPEKRIINS